MSDLFILLVQLATVLVVARLVGQVFRRLHQPQVVGEMVAGLLLGPSVLGVAAPGLSSALFPPASLGFLSTLSQLGLLLFMFLIGLELDPSFVFSQSRSAVAISGASIALPFGLGALLAYCLYPRFMSDTTNPTGFILFMGAAMSVTAFPVLARILQEQEMMGTPLGSLAIACAAVGDVAAWLILAVVVLLVRASNATLPLWLTVSGTLVFVSAMVLVVRPQLRRVEQAYERRGQLTQGNLTTILLLILVSGLLTEGLGIHALFGAFLAGAVLPKGEAFVQAITEKLRDVTVVLLVPLYFAFTGLRTSIGAIATNDLWGYGVLIVLVAIVGKWGGAMLAARATGSAWRQASAVGVLMNARGMVELVLLNVGLDIGVLSPSLFTLLVLMALVTTFMTRPLLDLTYRSHGARRAYAYAGQEQPSVAGR